MVGTPIGNLEDITLRALRVLGEVGLVVAEDTRKTRKLLTRFNIKVPLLSYHQHNAVQRTPRILEALADGDVALVTDAGTPAVSDPGANLAMAVRERGFPVTPIPGPSAVTTALSVAGMRADAFLFLGFLPRARRERLAHLRSVAAVPQTLVLFEAPHRLGPALADLRQALGDRSVTICRELTKLHEELFHGTLSEAMTHFTQPRGEFVLVVPGAEPETAPTTDLDAVRHELAALRAQGMTRRDSVAQVTAAHPVSRRVAYRLWLSLGEP